MVKLHVLLVSSFILNTSMAVGCASGFVEPASARPAETYKHLSDQAVLYRQEAVDLRAAAQYYEGEAQRSAWETGEDFGSDATLSRLCPTSFGAGPGGRSACRRVPAAVAVMS